MHTDTDRVNGGALEHGRFTNDLYAHSPSISHLARCSNSNSHENHCEKQKKKTSDAYRECVGYEK